MISHSALLRGLIPMTLPSTPLKVKIMLDSLYCVRESRWDHFTDSDEPYLVVAGFRSQPETSVWLAGNPHVFSDVDTGENRLIPPHQRVVFDGEVRPGETIGFTVAAWEADNCGSAARQNMAVTMVSFMLQTIRDAGPDIFDVPGGGTLLGLIAYAIGSYLEHMFSALACLLTGGGDDFVASQSVVLTYADLVGVRDAGVPSVSRRLNLDGGSEGHYHLRWHLEFGPQFGRTFNAGFKNYDDLVVGNLAGGAPAEILRVVRGDAPHPMGRFYVHSADGLTLRQFDAFFTQYDRVAIGNVLGDAANEIIVASEDDGGWIRIYSAEGASLKSWRARFTKFDGLAVGNLLGDGLAEIAIACDDDKKVYIYNGDGVLQRTVSIPFSYSGSRYTGSETRHDAFLVGDVAGDEYAELVLIRQAQSSSKVYVLDAAGTELRSPVTVFLSPFDGVALGDVRGDSKLELLIATDDGDGMRGCAIRAWSLVTGNQVAYMSAPLFGKYNGFAAGDVFGTGRAQVVVIDATKSLISIGQ